VRTSIETSRIPRSGVASWVSCELRRSAGLIGFPMTAMVEDVGIVSLSSA
jgi:hypothetical protein